MNHATIIGNLTRDPEIRTAQSGNSVASFTVAVTRRFKDANGERQSDFIPVVAFKALADLCGQYLAKGSKVAVGGSIQTRNYEAKDGTRRYVTEIIADEVEFLTRRDSYDQAPSTFAGATETDEDLPF